MSFAAIDGGGASRRPAAPNNNGSTGIPLEVSGTYKPTTSFAGPPTPGFGIPSSVAGTLPAPVGHPTDGGVGGFNPTIPAYTPGPMPGGGGDGGVASFTTTPSVPFTPVDTPRGGGGPQGVDLNSILQQALQRMGFSQLDSALQRAREQLIIKSGDSSLAGLAGFGLDPQAAAFAQQNYLSGNADLARLDKQKKQGSQAVINRLASHGLLFSGDLGHGLNENESNYGNARYDLTQSYLQQLQALLDNTLQQKQALRSNVVNALLSAYGNQVQDPSQLVGLYG